ncbi:hypothetical protein WR25_09970 [Diploscapter pachys]|uniref:Tudor domain-containing protein n=1 Tax=Diploscapter pachys TaxID=2018661 RepID=A0A2A2KQN2_9BILA|nr:hypothetical protein WR25_09970 [Diploscapter pachys]
MDVGWHLNESLLPSLLKNVPSDKKKLYAELCDLDMRSYGLPCISDATNKEKGVFEGPVVLQLVRYRNASVPKIKDGSTSARDCIIRVHLTDGQQAISGLFFGENCPISADTPPGTKLLLNGKIQLESFFLLLNRSNCTVLGGKVPQLIEKWNIENSAFRESMGPRKAENTAPKWISFGKRIDPGGAQTPRNFKANDVIKSAINKEKGPGESDDFDKARKETINAAKEEAAARKTFAAPNVNIPQPVKKEEPRPARVEKPVPATEQNERKGKFGRRGKRGDDEDDRPVPAEFARPSGPTTLFDFIAPSVGESFPQNSAPAPAAPSYNQNQNYTGRNNSYQNNRQTPQSGGQRQGYSGRGGRQGPGNQGHHQGGFQQRDNRRGGRQDAAAREGNAGNTQGRYRNMQFENSNRRQQNYSQNQSQSQSQSQYRAPPPALMASDFPSMNETTNALSQMSVGGQGQGRGRNQTPRWKVGDRCKAPWDDGAYYLARIIRLGPQEMCSVEFDGYGNVSTLPIAVLVYN